MGASILSQTVLAPRASGGRGSLRGWTINGDRLAGRGRSTTDDPYAAELAASNAKRPVVREQAADDSSATILVTRISSAERCRPRWRRQPR